MNEGKGSFNATFDDEGSGNHYIRVKLCSIRILSNVESLYGSPRDVFELFGDSDKS